MRVLQLQTRPELNGAEGTLVSFDEEDQRWNVLMDDGTSKMLRPDNVEVTTSHGDGCGATPAAAIAEMADVAPTEAGRGQLRRARASAAHFEEHSHLIMRLGDHTRPLLMILARHMQILAEAHRRIQDEEF